MGRERVSARRSIYIFRVTCMVWCQVTAAAADAVTRLHGSADAPNMTAVNKVIIINKSGETGGRGVRGDSPLKIFKWEEGDA